MYEFRLKTRALRPIGSRVSAVQTVVDRVTERGWIRRHPYRAYRAQRLFLRAHSCAPKEFPHVEAYTASVRTDAQFC